VFKLMIFGVGSGKCPISGRSEDGAFVSMDGADQQFMSWSGLQLLCDIKCEQMKKGK
jgi:hypothetical protein